MTQIWICRLLGPNFSFDSVPHKRLIEKLRGYGIRDNLLCWIENFLSSRSQFVYVNGYKSKSVPVTSGVPQVVSWGRHFSFII